MIKCDQCGYNEATYIGKKKLCSTCLKIYEKYWKARQIMYESLFKAKK